MNFKELQQLTRLLKQLKEIKNIQNGLRQREELKEFLRQTGDVGGAGLEWLREQVDYDRDEWCAMMGELKKGV